MLAIIFLIVIAAVVPLLAYAGRQQIARGVDLARTAVYGQALVSQAMIGALGVAAAVSINMPLLPWFVPDRDAARASFALLLLLVALAAMFLGLRTVSPLERRIFDLLAPATKNERSAWIGICAIVAVVEELVYRAVLPAVLEKWLDDRVLVIATSAVLFGLAHLLQGWKGFAVTALFAVPLHLLVDRGGSLTNAIAVHFVYDVVAGFAIRRRLSRSS